MLTDTQLLEIHAYLSNAFTKSIVQEVALRILERREDNTIRNWPGYAFATARYLRWKKNNRDLRRNNNIDLPNLTLATSKDSIEKQLIARHELQYIASSEKGVKLMRYVLKDDRWCSRPRIVQLRKELREELE